SAPSAASRRRASCAVPRVAVKWTSAGATAPAAGARRASNDRRTVGLSDGRTVNTHPIAVIGGDGIGPEVIEAAIPVLERAAAKYGFGLELERLPYSADHYLKTRETLPDHAFRHLQDDVDAIFLGALGDPRVPGNEHARDILLGLRFRLDLYINFRPVKLLHPDLGVLRSDRSTVRTSDRPTIDFAIFRENTEGGYLGRGRLVGGLGLAASANLHPGRAGLFEPVHGSAPPLAGKGIANPMAAVLTGALMFEQLRHLEAARDLERAVQQTLAAGVRTPDLGGGA